MLQITRQLWRPSSFKQLSVLSRSRPGAGASSLLISISCSYSPLESVNYSSPCDWGSLFCPSTLSWGIREAHTGTAGKSHGRRKKSINPSSLQYTKRGDAHALEEDMAEVYVEKDSKGQSKRKALRAREWGSQLASLSPSQLRQAIRLASLDTEVYEAVMLVKSLGPNVRNGKRRQYNYIGGLLRDADPELMEQVLTACKDGDLSGLTINTNMASSESSEDETSDEERVNFSQEELTARQWLEGLLGGDDAINGDVFSYSSDVFFDRQELKRLMWMAKQTQDVSSTDRSEEATKAHNALFEFLYGLAQRRQNEV